MPTIKAVTLIESALRIGGIVASGETPEEDEKADALVTLNDLLNLWSLDPLLNYERLHFTVSIPNTTVPLSMTLPHVVTADTANTVAVVEPALWLRAAWYRVSGKDTPLTLFSEMDYASIEDKTTSGAPSHIHIAKRRGELQLYLYPVPPSGGAIHLIGALPFPTFPALTDSFVFPVGYEVALRYNLAVLLAGEYNIEPSNIVMAQASNTLIALQSLTNRLLVPPTVPAAVVAGSVGGMTFMNSGD